MERLHNRSSEIPGVRIELFGNVSLHDLSSFRKEAILFVAERELDPEELLKLSNKTSLPIIVKEFKHGLRMRRFNFPFGGFLEEWKDENNLYRMTFDGLRRRMRTTRYSTP